MDKGVHSNELYNLCLSHFNEPMLSFEELARCIGYGETGVDCYIITRRIGGEIVWNTCVGGYVWLNRLKEQGAVTSSTGDEWNDLSRLDADLTRRGAPREQEFMLVLHHDDMERSAFERPTDEAADG